MADELFQKHTVLELRAIELKMRYKPKTERYRDLLEAADSVRSMKDAAVGVQSMLTKLDNGCNVKKLRSEIDATILTGRDEALEEKKMLLYPIAAQIKLLVDAPEQIWHAIESHAYLRAARVFQVAHAVYRNLQNTHDPAMLKVYSFFPVVQRQWDAISHFRPKIKEKALAHLQDTSASDQSITETLCCVMLLDKRTPRESLEMFLKERKALILSIIQVPPRDIDGIAPVLKTIIHIIHWTLQQVYAIYHSDDGKSAETSSLLNKLMNDNEKPAQGMTTNLAGTISGLYSGKTNVHLILRHLPSSITSSIAIFNLGRSTDLVTNSILHEEIRKWIDVTISESDAGIRQVISNVNSGKVLAAIRSQVIKAIHEETTRDISDQLSRDISRTALTNSRSTNSDKRLGWNELCKRLIDGELSLWSSIFEPVFHSISLDIMKKSLESMARQPHIILNQIIDAMQSTVADRAVSDFIWAATDASSFSAGIVSHQFCRTQTPLLSDIEKTFAACLDAIKADVGPLLANDISEKDGVNAVTYNNDKLQAPFQALFLQAVSDSCSGLLNSLDTFKSEEMSNEAIDACLLLGRCAKALSLKLLALAPSVIFMEQKNSHTEYEDITLRYKYKLYQKPQIDPRLAEKCDQFMQVYFAAHSIWINFDGRRFEHDLDHALRSEDWNTCVGFLGSWEAVTLRTKSDSGEVQDDILKLPVHASRFVIQSLFTVADNLNRVSGYSIENASLNALVTRLREITFRIYDKFCDSLNQADAMSEKAYVQIVFDFNYLCKILLGSWGLDLNQKIAVSETKSVDALSLLAKLKSKIDPVDWAVISPYLTDNIDRFYNRTSVVIGGLIAINPKLSDLKKPPSVNELHNVIPVLGQIPRFTLLPITYPGIQTWGSVSSAGPTPRASMSAAAGERAGDKKLGGPDSRPTRVRKPRPALRLTGSAPSSSAMGTSGMMGFNTTTTPGAGTPGMGKGVTSTVISGVVGLVGAATSAATTAAQSALSAQGAAGPAQWNLGVNLPSQKSLLGGATAVFAALTGTGATGVSPQQGGSTGQSGGGTQSGSNSPSVQRRDHFTHT
ncbi:Golgi transport complex subunit 1 [Blyttiomyces sp. JEL0837]|nr:Golgi transport complex subunit 1 [Blyttiomyces sp. JEL0837]